MGQVADLGVGEQVPITQHRRADAGSEGEHQHCAFFRAFLAVIDLGQSGCVGVIKNSDLPLAEVALEQLLHIGIDPRLIDVRRGASLLILDHGGHRYAHRAIPFGHVHQLAHDLRHCIRGGGLRGEDLKTLGDQLAGVEVYNGAFDTGPADIHAETQVLLCLVLSHAHNTTLKILGCAWHRSLAV